MNKYIHYLELNQHFTFIRLDFNFLTIIRKLWIVFSLKIKLLILLSSLLISFLCFFVISNNDFYSNIYINFRSNNIPSIFINNYVSDLNSYISNKQYNILASKLNINEDSAKKIKNISLDISHNKLVADYKSTIIVLLRLVNTNQFLFYQKKIIESLENLSFNVKLKKKELEYYSNLRKIYLQEINNINIKRSLLLSKNSNLAFNSKKITDLNDKILIIDNNINNKDIDIIDDFKRYDTISNNLKIISLVLKFLFVCIILFFCQLIIYYHFNVKN